MRLVEYRKHVLHELGAAELESDKRLVKVRSLTVGTHMPRRQRLIIFDKGSKGLVGVLQIDPANVAGECEKRQSFGTEKCNEQQIQNVQRIGSTRRPRVFALLTRRIARRNEHRRPKSFTSHRR